MNIFEISLHSDLHGYIEFEVYIKHYHEVEGDWSCWSSSDDYYGYVELEFDLHRVISFRDGWDDSEYDEYFALLKELNLPYQNHFSLDMLNDSEYDEVEALVLDSVRKMRDNYY